MSTRATAANKAITVEILESAAYEIELWNSFSESDEPTHVQTAIGCSCYPDATGAQRAINAVKRYLFLDLKSRADDWSVTVPASVTADVLRLVAARERGQKLVPNTWP